MVIALVIVLVSVVAFISMTAPKPPQDNYAPDLTMPIGKNGANVQLSDLKDHVVLLDFWATWCGPCRMSIPELQHLHEKYRDKGLVVIGLSTDNDSSRKEVPRMKKELGMTYATAFTDDIPDVRSKFVFVSLPMLYVIDRKGVIREKINGYDPNSTLEDKVVKLLNEPEK